MPSRPVPCAGRSSWPSPRAVGFLAPCPSASRGGKAVPAAVRAAALGWSWAAALPGVTPAPLAVALGSCTPRNRPDFSRRRSRGMVVAGQPGVVAVPVPAGWRGGATLPAAACGSLCHPGFPSTSPCPPRPRITPTSSLTPRRETDPPVRGVTVSSGWDCPLVPCHLGSAWPWGRGMSRSGRAPESLAAVGGRSAGDEPGTKSGAAWQSWGTAALHHRAALGWSRVLSLSPLGSVSPEPQPEPASPVAQHPVTDRRRVARPHPSTAQDPPRCRGSAAWLTPSLLSPQKSVPRPTSAA